MKFGTMIRAHRLRQNLSMDKVCRQVDLSKAYLSLIETGQKGPPKDEIIVQIAKALGLEDQDLLMRAHRERFPEDVLELRRLAQEMRQTLLRLNEVLDREADQSSRIAAEEAAVMESADSTPDFFLEMALSTPAPVEVAEQSTIRCAKILHQTLKELERLLPSEMEGAGELAGEVEDLRAEERQFLQHIIQGIKQLRPRRGPQTMGDD